MSGGHLPLLSGEAKRSAFDTRRYTAGVYSRGESSSLRVASYQPYHRGASLIDRVSHQPVASNRSIISGTRLEQEKASSLQPEEDAALLKLSVESLKLQLEAERSKYNTSEDSLKNKGQLQNYERWQELETQNRQLNEEIIQLRDKAKTTEQALNENKKALHARDIDVQSLQRRLKKTFALAQEQFSNTDHQANNPNYVPLLQHNTEISKFKNDVQDYVERCRTLESEKKALREENDKIRAIASTVSKTEANYSMMQALNEELRQSNDELQRQVNNSMNTIKGLRAESEKIKAERDIYSSKISEQTQQIEANRSKYDEDLMRVQAIVDDTKKDCQKLLQERATFKAERESLKRKIQELEEDLKFSTTQREQLMNDYSKKLKLANEDFSSKESSLQQKVASLRDALSAATKEGTSHKMSLDEAQQRNSIFMERLSHAHAMLSRAMVPSAENFESQISMDESQRIVTSLIEAEQLDAVGLLNRHVANLENILLSMESERISSLTEKRRLLQAQSQLEARNTQLVQDLSTADGKLDHFEEQIVPAYASELKLQGQKTEEWKRAASEAHDSSNTFKRRLEAAESKLELHEQKLHKCEELLNRAGLVIYDQEGRLSDLNERGEFWRERANILSAEILKLEEQLRENSDILAYFSDGHVNLSDEVDNADALLLQESKEFEDSLFHANTEIASLKKSIISLHIDKMDVFVSMDASMRLCHAEKMQRMRVERNFILLLQFLVNSRNSAFKYVDSLYRRMNELQLESDKLDVMEGELEQLYIQRGDAAANYSAASRSLEEHKRMWKQMNFELQHLSEENNQLEMTRKTLETTLQRKELQLEDVSNGLKALTEEANSLSQENKYLTDARAEDSKMIESLKNELSSITDAATDQSMSLKQEIKTSNLESSRLTAELVEVRTKLSQFEAHEKHLMEFVETLYAESCVLQELVKVYNQKMALIGDLKPSAVDFSNDTRTTLRVGSMLVSNSPCGDDSSLAAKNWSFMGGFQTRPVAPVGEGNASFNTMSSFLDLQAAQERFRASSSNLKGLETKLSSLQTTFNELFDRYDGEGGISRESSFLAARSASSSAAAGDSIALGGGVGRAQKLSLRDILKSFMEGIRDLKQNWNAFFSFIKQSMSNAVAETRLLLQQREKLIVHASYNAYSFKKMLDAADVMREAFSGSSGEEQKERASLSYPHSGGSPPSLEILKRIQQELQDMTFETFLNMKGLASLECQTGVEYFDKRNDDVKRSRNTHKGGELLSFRQTPLNHHVDGFRQDTSTHYSSGGTNSAGSTSPRYLKSKKHSYHPHDAQSTAIVLNNEDMYKKLDICEAELYEFTERLRDPDGSRMSRLLEFFADLLESQRVRESEAKGFLESAGNFFRRMETETAYKVPSWGTPKDSLELSFNSVMNFVKALIKNYAASLSNTLRLKSKLMFFEMKNQSRGELYASFYRKLIGIVKEICQQSSKILPEQMKQQLQQVLEAAAAHTQANCGESRKPFGAASISQYKPSASPTSKASPSKDDKIPTILKKFDEETFEALQGFESVINSLQKCESNLQNSFLSSVKSIDLKLVQQVESCLASSKLTDMATLERACVLRLMESKSSESPANGLMPELTEKLRKTEMQLMEHIETLVNGEAQAELRSSFEEEVERLQSIFSRQLEYFWAVHNAAFVAVSNAYHKEITERESQGRLLKEQLDHIANKAHVVGCAIIGFSTCLEDCLVQRVPLPDDRTRHNSASAGFQGVDRGFLEQDDLLASSRLDSSLELRGNAKKFDNVFSTQTFKGLKSNSSEKLQTPRQNHPESNNLQGSRGSFSFGDNARAAIGFSSLNEAAGPSRNNEILHNGSFASLHLSLSDSVSSHLQAPPRSLTQTPPSSQFEALKHQNGGKLLVVLKRWISRLKMGLPSEVSASFAADENGGRLTASQHIGASLVHINKLALVSKFLHDGLDQAFLKGSYKATADEIDTFTQHCYLEGLRVVKQQPKEYRGHSRADGNREERGLGGVYALFSALFEEDKDNQRIVFKIRPSEGVSSEVDIGPPPPTADVYAVFSNALLHLERLVMNLVELFAAHFVTRVASLEMEKEQFFARSIDQLLSEIHALSISKHELGNECLALKESIARAEASLNDATKERDTLGVKLDSLNVKLHCYEEKMQSLNAKKYQFDSFSCDGGARGGGLDVGKEGGVNDDDSRGLIHQLQANAADLEAALERRSEELRAALARNKVLEEQNNIKLRLGRNTEGTPDSLSALKVANRNSPRYSIETGEISMSTPCFSEVLSKKIDSLNTALDGFVKEVSNTADLLKKLDFDELKHLIDYLLLSLINLKRANASEELARTHNSLVQAKDILLELDKTASLARSSFTSSCDCVKAMSHSIRFLKKADENNESDRLEMKEKLEFELRAINEEKKELQKKLLEVEPELYMIREKFAGLESLFEAKIKEKDEEYEKLSVKFNEGSQNFALMKSNFSKAISELKELKQANQKGSSQSDIASTNGDVLNEILQEGERKSRAIHDLRQELNNYKRNDEAMRHELQTLKKNQEETSISQNVINGFFDASISILNTNHALNNELENFNQEILSLKAENSWLKKDALSFQAEIQQLQGRVVELNATHTNESRTNILDKRLEELKDLKQKLNQERAFNQKFRAEHNQYKVVNAVLYQCMDFQRNHFLSGNFPAKPTAEASSRHTRGSGGNTPDTKSLNDSASKTGQLAHTHTLAKHRYSKDQLFETCRLLSLQNFNLVFHLRSLILFIYLSMGEPPVHNMQSSADYEEISTAEALFNEACWNSLQAILETPNHREDQLQSDRLMQEGSMYMDSKFDVLAATWINRLVWTWRSEGKLRWMPINAPIE